MPTPINPVKTMMLARLEWTPIWVMKKDPMARMSHADERQGAVAHLEQQASAQNAGRSSSTATWASG